MAVPETMTGTVVQSPVEIENQSNRNVNAPDTLPLEPKGPGGLERDIVAVEGSKVAKYSVPMPGPF